MFDAPRPAPAVISRRRLLRRAGASALGLRALSCAPAPTAAPTKPAEAPKPASEPTKPAAPVGPAASPAASPAAKPAASPSPSPAVPAAPAAKPVALPNLSGVNLTVLQWSSFIPEADPFFRGRSRTIS